MAGCILLVGISYLILRVFMGVLAVPRTPVREMNVSWQMVLPLSEEVLDMEVDRGGLYLACITAGGEGNRLLVVDLEGGSVVWESSIEGRELAWLGEKEKLVYEDAGDIFILDMEGTKTTNLTADGELDQQPRPSPLGDLILWTRVDPRTGEPGLWLMLEDGSEKRPLAPLQELVTWDPEGRELVSLGGEQEAGEEGAFFLQKTSLGAEGWSRFCSCEGPVYYLWWPVPGDVLMVGPWRSGEETRGVVFRARPGEKAARVASSSGLSDDARRYRFFPERGGTRLAYVGDKGLEILDYAQKLVYRFPYLEAEPPLAWDEKTGELYFAGRDGIYRIGTP